MGSGNAPRRDGVDVRTTGVPHGVTPDHRAGAGDEEIARSVGVGGSTVYRTKRRFVEGNLERALSEEPRPGAERKLTGKEEALLVATACASPPKGRARWTLELLAGACLKAGPRTRLLARSTSAISRSTARSADSPDESLRFINI